MAEYKTNEILADPDFVQTDRDTQRAVLSKWDSNFAQLTPDRQNAMLDTYIKGSKKAEMAVEKSFAEKATEMYQGVAKSAAGMVGRGVENVTEPLVTGQRMISGQEPMGQILGGPVRGATRHPPTSQAVGEAVVPQEPWQAAAIAGSAIPGMVGAGPIAKAVPALSRVLSSSKAWPRIAGAAAGGEVGGQVSGLSTGEGALKGGAAQSVGELLGKGVGVARRSLPGKSVRIADEEAARVSDVLSSIVPEFAPIAGKQKGASQRLGEFFAGTPQAKNATELAFQERLDYIQNLLPQSDPFLRSPMISEAWAILVRAARSDPALRRQLDKLAPAPAGQGTQGGFLVDQAAKILALRRDRLSHPANPTATAHETGEVIKELAEAIKTELTLRAPNVGELFTEARRGVGRAHGLREILEKGFPESKGGYDLNMSVLQKAMSDPTLAARFTPDEIAALNYAFTRGAQRVPGFMDIGTRSEHFLPFTPTGAGVMGLRKLFGRKQYQGRKPLTAAPSTKAGLGLAGLLGIPPTMREKE